MSDESNVALETEIAFVRRTLEELNEVVVEQADRIAALETHVRALTRTVTELRPQRDAVSQAAADEPPPPHY